MPPIVEARHQYVEFQANAWLATIVGGSLAADRPTIEEGTRFETSFRWASGRKMVWEGAE